MLRRDEVEPRLRALLREEGADLERLALGALVPATRAMARLADEPVQDAVPPEGDGVFLQWGPVEHWRGEPVAAFLLDVTRQLTFYNGDDYDVMKHLSCSFLFPLAPELEAFDNDDQAYEPGEDWLAPALQSPVMRCVLELRADRCSPKSPSMTCEGTAYTRSSATAEGQPRRPREASRSANFESCSGYHSPRRLLKPPSAPSSKGDPLPTSNRRRSG